MISKTIYISDNGNQFDSPKEALLDEGKNVCPKCQGKGLASLKYNSYPSNLPDSDYVEKWAYKDEVCDICNGRGFTDKKLVPTYKQVFDGYKEEN